MDDFSGLLEKLLDRALVLGASYADARFQKYDRELIVVDNNALKSYSSRTHRGIGIRVITEGSTGFASTSVLRWKGLETSLENALKAARSNKTNIKTEWEPRVNRADAKLPVKTNPIDVSPEEKISLVLDTNKAACISNEIRSTTTRLGLSHDFRYFTSTEGAEVNVETSLVGVFHISIAKSEGVMERVFSQESRCSGWEFMEKRDWNTFAKDVSALAMETVKSRTPPPRSYPVVIDPDAIGIVLHEAFGHLAEGDVVATGWSVLQNKLGKPIISNKITIFDEGTIDGGYFYPYDDEGVEKGKTTLVEEGVLKGYLHNSYSAQKLSTQSTGNGRAQDFENIPIVRQTNTCMAPGDQTLEELIEDIDFGILVKGKGARGGQVRGGVGAFTFSVGPSNIIRNGEIAEVVRGVAISGIALETFNSIDAVGSGFKVKTNAFGGCGKMGQDVHTGIGGPYVRIQKMTIGGL